MWYSSGLGGFLMHPQRRDIINMYVKSLREVRRHALRASRRTDTTPALTAWLEVYNYNRGDLGAYRSTGIYGLRPVK